MRKLLLLALAVPLSACDLGLGLDFCLASGGYQPGVTPSGHVALEGDNEPTLSGTHLKVKPILLAAGSEEGLLATLPLSTPGASDNLNISANGDLSFVEPIDKQCSTSKETTLKGRFQASATGGKGRVLVMDADKTLTSFPIEIVPATALQILAPEAALVVGKTTKICAVAESASGQLLYADDSLKMTVDGPAQLDLFDPGGACRTITGEGPGDVKITVTGLGLTTETTVTVLSSH